MTGVAPFLPVPLGLAPLETYAEFLIVAERAAAAACDVADPKVRAALLDCASMMALALQRADSGPQVPLEERVDRELTRRVTRKP